MHLLATTSGVIDGAAEAIDLKQTPADVVILTAADSELANLANAAGHTSLTIRLANLMQLQHNFAVDIYAEKTLRESKLIIIRILGGAAYWAYGIEVIEALARENNIKLVLLSGGNDVDLNLTSRSTVNTSDCERIRQYLAFGGHINATALLQFCDHLINNVNPPAPATSLAPAGIYHTHPNAKLGIVFYRSVIEGGQTAPIDGLIKALGGECTAIYAASLKDQSSAAFIRENFKSPSVIINATSFAVGDEAADPLANFDCPVLQVTLAGNTEAEWRETTRGLRPPDLAMSVVLPELDGRIYTRAISFKADHLWHEKTQCRIVTYQPVQNRIEYVAALALNWMRLRETANPQKHIAIILANYPDKDGRIANGVGYDTPASTIEILKALWNEGYEVGEIPSSGNDLIFSLSSRRKSGPRKASTGGDHLGPDFRRDDCVLSLENYNEHFEKLPELVRTQITSQWGSPETDPTFHNNAFRLAIDLYGNIAVAIQPPRGYGIDPKSTYHDPALVPPHGYIAFYFWLRHQFKAHAIIHNGKHGNLEWLPGKATALSENCYPEITLGPTPQLYPFIVNDPGEGTQAKRRTSAVIIDHLTPPLTRAESYGPMKDLEVLVDEYYLASGLDQRRVATLRAQIFELTSSTKLDKDAGLTGTDDGDLQKLDGFLCDLKEAQIRDGLHILGKSPTGQQETDLLVALTRVPRGLGEDGDASLIKAISDDFGFADFDPLTCNMADPWKGERPTDLLKLLSSPWRSNGDTVERLELYATQLLSSRRKSGPRLGFVLENIERKIRPALTSCGPNELASLLRGLAGRRVKAGPSGAPTRGRLDVLPTGKNFYSLDNRAVPTPTAWTLGQKSADELLMRHFQDTGQHLKTAGLSAWGTANMRTGGDDIAQALALIGAKPVWDTSSWRVTGYEIIPMAKLARPRVDVTLRISGFFRDAFPTQIELLDKAFRAVAALDEPVEDNPLAAYRDSHRIFGAKPGAYGAGLQALIDEKIWDTKADLAAAYMIWGAYAYGAKAMGENDEATFTRRLAGIEAVIHNQDNREHDLLDSDDYYQFEGGMSAAVETHSGQKPKVYHNDHSRPERPVIRTLEEEISRVMRSRVVNPKWINGVKRHGYKGAFEIAATVDYMFAFAATTGAVQTHHFDLAYDAYVADDETRGFIAENNPAALKEIAARFEEAIARNLWQPRLNSAYDRLKDLQK